MNKEKAEQNKEQTLEVRDGCLVFTDGDQEIKGDFARMKKRLTKGNLQTEILLKAARIKNPEGELTAVDATAGLGDDSILLAAAGFKVTMYEKDPIIFQLLEDALKRGLEDEELFETVSRMTVKEGDSISAMRALAERIDKGEETRPDVILLDPMFPKRQKSALVKKKFQLIHQLEKPCENEKELLDAAMKVRPRKLVIKRPVKGPYLADMRPDYSISGKAVRYDCFAYA